MFDFDITAASVADGRLFYVLSSMCVRESRICIVASDTENYRNRRVTLGRGARFLSGAVQPHNVPGN